MSNQISPLPPALAQACCKGDVSSVRTMFSKSSSSGKGSSYLNSMAILAAQNGHPDILRFCFSEGLSLPLGGSVNDLLIFAACDGASIPAFEVLLDNGLDINSEVELADTHSRAADILSGAIDAEGEELGTPLYLAAKRGNLDLVKFLLQKGANATWKDNEGRTARKVADANGHASIAAVLPA